MPNLDGFLGRDIEPDGQGFVVEADLSADSGRRDFLKGVAAMVAAAVGSSVFGGCGRKEPKETGAPEVPAEAEAEAPSNVGTEAEAEAQVQVRASSEEIANLKRRKEVFLSSLEAGERIARQTGDKEALAVIAFVKDSYVLTEPAAQGLACRVIEVQSGSGEQWIFATPLIAGDEFKSAEWNRIMKSLPAAGMFLPDINTLVVDGVTPFSEFTKGILALHEGRHAQRFVTDKYDWKDTRTFCCQERDTHEFQNRLTATIGGKKYQDLLGREVARLKAELDGAGIPVGIGMAPRSPYHAEFDEIFGPALSDKDRKFRETSFWIDANFRLLEKYSKGDVAEQKALFLKTTYAEGGLLPGS